MCTQREVGVEPRRAGAVDAHAKGTRRVERAGDDLPCAVLVRGRDRVLEIDDHRVRAGRDRLCEALGTRAWHEQVRTRDKFR